MRFLTVLLRSFLLQASWNYHRLQGIGWSVTIEPLLRMLPGGRHGRAYQDAVSRSARYFNSHPFFATFAVGAVARAEMDNLSPERIERLRDAIKGPLGSVGDRLVWAGLLPLASSLAVLGAVVISPLVGLVTFLVVFNVVHVVIRWWGLRSGWRLGRNVGQALHHPVLQGAVRVSGALASLAFGIATPVVATYLFAGFAVGARIGGLVAAVVTVLFLRWLFPTIGAARLGIILVVGALLIGGVWP